MYCVTGGVSKEDLDLIKLISMLCKIMMDETSMRDFTETEGEYFHVYIRETAFNDAGQKSRQRKKAMLVQTLKEISSTRFFLLPLIISCFLFLIFLLVTVSLKILEYFRRSLGGDSKKTTITTKKHS